ncbi:hypothetical protein STEG23_018664 [Scotinomys teguina]
MWLMESSEMGPPQQLHYYPWLTAAATPTAGRLDPGVMYFILTQAHLSQSVLLDFLSGGVMIQSPHWASFLLPLGPLSTHVGSCPLAPAHSSDPPDLGIHPKAELSVVSTTGPEPPRKGPLGSFDEQAVSPELCSVWASGDFVRHSAFKTRFLLLEPPDTLLQLLTGSHLGDSEKSLWELRKKEQAGADGKMLFSIVSGCVPECVWCSPYPTGDSKCLLLLPGWPLLGKPDLVAAVTWYRDLCAGSRDFCVTGKTLSFPWLHHYLGGTSRPPLEMKLPDPREATGLPPMTTVLLQGKFHSELAWCCSIKEPWGMPVARICLTEADNLLSVYMAFAVCDD